MTPVSLAQNEAKKQRPRINQHRIDGQTAFILLPTEGASLEVAVDTNDLELVLSYSLWTRVKAISTSYAFARLRLEDGSRPCMLLHRLIMNAPRGAFVDHLNRNGLDCRRSNLRIVNKSQNAQNASCVRKSRSGIKNVCWDNTRSQWRVTVKAEGKSFRGGLYDSVEDAALAASALRQRLHTHCPENTEVIK